jgi:hypothetical protein
MSSEPAVHQEAVRAAVCDALGSGPVSGASVVALRTRLVDGLSQVPGSPGVIVDGFRLSRVAQCPASYVPEPFYWSAPRAARSLGLRALRAMTTATRLGVQDAVGVAVDDAIGEDCSVGRWLAAQDAPSRGATVAAVVSWAARAWVAVPWHQVGTVNLSTGAIIATPLGRSGWIALRGSPDAVIQPKGGRRDDPCQVLLRLGGPSPVALGLDALVFALLRGVAPLRVVTIQPSSGLVAALDVTRELLQDTVDRVVTVAADNVGRAGLAESPGRHCWHCPRRDRCATGGAWMRDQPRRVGGIPVPAAGPAAGPAAVPAAAGPAAVPAAVPAVAVPAIRP